MSDSACIKLFLSAQVQDYDNRKNFFMESWNRCRFKKVQNTFKSKTHSESISISVPLNEALNKISDELDVTRNELVVNMIKMELNKCFGEYDSELAVDKKEIETVKYTGDIRMSNIVKVRLETIAQYIGIPVNSLISDILIKYLIANYVEFDVNEEEFWQDL